LQLVGKKNKYKRTATRSREGSDHSVQWIAIIKNTHTRGFANSNYASQNPKQAKALSKRNVLYVIGNFQIRKW